MNETAAILKCHSNAFNSVWSGEKRAEFRADDRMYGTEKLYEKGRIITLQEFEYGKEELLPRLIDIEITDVQRGCFGIPDGYCMFSFRVLACRDLSSRDEYQDTISVSIPREYQGGPRSAQIAWREGFETGMERMKAYLLQVDRRKWEQSIGVMAPKGQEDVIEKIIATVGRMYDEIRNLRSN